MEEAGRVRSAVLWLGCHARTVPHNAWEMILLGTVHLLLANRLVMAGPVVATQSTVRWVVWLHHAWAVHQELARRGRTR